MISLYLLIAVLLLLLNAFFVLAEFAALKVRPSRVEELIAQGSGRAKVFQHIQSHLDEYLSVCQIGITVASIGLGWVGEQAFAGMLAPALRWTGAASPAVAHGIATAAAFLLVTFLHILLGELVPKSVALRASEPAALASARPLVLFRTLFHLPLVMLNGSANAILRLIGLGAAARHQAYSERELRIILGKSQQEGLMPFRRLLLMENLFELSTLKVRDAMRGREAARTLRADAPWEEVFRLVRETGFSRYLLLEEGRDLPSGFVHLKDLLYLGPEGLPAADLRKLARPLLTTREDTPLEVLLGEFQRRQRHMAIVTDATGRWSGLITMEDVVEEIIGTVQDEFTAETLVSVAEAMDPGRILLGLEASSIEEAIRKAFATIPALALPVPAARATKAVLDREESMSTFLGKGLAIPHARLEEIDRAIIIFARSETGIPLRETAEKAHLLFILLTPSNQPHVQVRLLARISSVLMESDFVEERLRLTQKPQEILEVIRECENAVLG